MFLCACLRSLCGPLSNEGAIGVGQLNTAEREMECIGDRGGGPGSRGEKRATLLLLLTHLSP